MVTGVYAIVNGTRRDAHQHKDGVFKCFPPSTNKVERAKVFHDLDKVADFLAANPDWGVRMQPGHSIIYRNIQIER